MILREYQYVGPSEIFEIARTQPSGTPISKPGDLAAWLATNPTELLPDGTWIATFTIGTDRVLNLAPRRSEHVACAGGGPVLSAGEIVIDKDFEVVEISNQSTGFCPEPNSWSAAEYVLDEIGLIHPGEFTNRVVFRRCTKCKQRNIVKDDWFVCQVCEAELPEIWNFDYEL